MDEHIDYITATASFEIHAGGDKTCPINSISINWYESLFAFSMSSEPALFILWTDERDNNPFFVVLCAPEKMTIAVKYVFAFERLPKLKKRKRCHRGHSRTKIQLKPVRERFACDHWKERERERRREAWWWWGMEGGKWKKKNVIFILIIMIIVMCKAIAILYVFLTVVNENLELHRDASHACVCEYLARSLMKLKLAAHHTPVNQTNAFGRCSNL